MHLQPTASVCETRLFPKEANFFFRRRFCATFDDGCDGRAALIMRCAAVAACPRLTFEFQTRHSPRGRCVASNLSIVSRQLCVDTVSPENV